MRVPAHPEELGCSEGWCVCSGTGSLRPAIVRPFVMPTIVVRPEIKASLERCFDVARDLETHCKTAAFSQEKVIGRKTAGLLELNDTITFEGKHFGLRQRLTAKIVEFDRPNRFVDEMVSGAFKSLRHRHEFKADGATTIMTDTITWVSPLGLLGKQADILIAPHLRSFLRRRNDALRQLAESCAGP